MAPKATKAFAGEIQTLVSKGIINSAEDFWDRLASDPDFIDNTLPADSKQRVTDLAADIAVLRAKRITRSRLRDHLLDVCVVLVIGLVLYGVLRDRVPIRVFQFVVVSKTGGLEPFQIITSQDVSLGSGTPSSSIFTSVNDVVGRYALEYIPSGAALERSRASAGARLSNELSQRRVLRVKLQPSTVLAGLKLPVRLDVLVSPREKDLSFALLRAVYILDVHSEADGISAVVAISDADFNKLAPLISRSDLIPIGLEP